MVIDIQQFLAATFTQPMSTKREPVPPKDYVALIDEIELETFPGKKDTSKTYLKLSLIYSVDDPELKKQLNRDKVLVYDDFLLDLTEGGGLDFGKGKNVKLGRLREACGQNKEGQPWGFQMLKGQVVRIKVGQEMYKGDPQSTVEAVTAVQ